MSNCIVNLIVVWTYLVEYSNKANKGAIVDK